MDGEGVCQTVGDALTLPSLFLFTVVRNAGHGSDKVGVRHRDSGGHGHGWVD
jgi:hypothetical protein